MRSPPSRSIRGCHEHPVDALTLDEAGSALRAVDSIIFGKFTTAELSVSTPDAAPGRCWYHPNPVFGMII